MVNKLKSGLCQRLNHIDHPDLIPRDCRIPSVISLSTCIDTHVQNNMLNQALAEFKAERVIKNKLVITFEHLELLEAVSA